MSPIYDYKCVVCKHVDAELLPIAAAEPTITKTCEQCNDQTNHVKLMQESPSIGRVDGAGGSPSR